MLNKSKNRMMFNLFSESVFTTYYRQFALAYSDLAENSHPLSALSILSQNKAEIIENKTDIVNGIGSLSDIYLKDIGQDEAIDNLKRAYRSSRKGQIRQTLFLQSNEEVFYILIQNYLKENYDDLFYAEILYTDLEKYFNELNKFEAIQAVIKYVINNDYPQTITSEPTSEQIEVSKNVGRRKDLNQEHITERVSEIIEFAKAEKSGYKYCWHHSGRYKGNPNKNQIKEKLLDEGLATIEENGKERTLEDRTILNYIDTALIQLGYMKK